MHLQSRTAVITGAGSGIGRAIAISLAARGCHLALADINESGLKETLHLVRAPSLRVSAHPLDVSDRAQVAALPAQVLAEHPGVDILVNNAGVSLGGHFHEVSDEDFEWLFGVNFFGVLRMTRAFMPLLRKSDDARLVNISSVYGIVAPAGQAAYASSKFAVRGFSEALRHELEGSTVGVTVVHPGGVATSIADNARIPAGADPVEVARRRSVQNKLLRMPPAKAGEIIVSGIERRQKRVLVGWDAHAVSWLARLVPVSYWAVLSRRVSEWRR